MPRLLRSAVVAGVMSLAAAASANATTGAAMYMQDGTPGTGSNTAAVSGGASPATNYGNHAFSIGGAILSCADANFTVTSVATTSMTSDLAYSGCQMLVSGTPVAAATVNSCDWFISGGIFDTSTGGVTGASMTMNCVLTFEIAAIGCTVHFPAQTKPGISTNNILQTGADTTAATPWGMKIVASVPGVTYTSTGMCPGVAVHGTGTYIGTSAVRGVTAGL